MGMETRESLETEKLDESEKGALSETDDIKDLDEKQEERKSQYKEIDFDDDAADNDSDKDVEKKPVNQILQTPESVESKGLEDKPDQKHSARTEFMERYKYSFPDTKKSDTDNLSGTTSGGSGNETNDSKDGKDGGIPTYERD